MRNVLRKILACAGVNGDEAALQKLVKAATERQPDGVLFAGGMVAPEAGTSQKVEFLARFFQSVGKLGQTVAFIPGPHETPLHEFYRAVLGAEVAFPSLFSVHATPWSSGEVAVSGIGGLITDSEDAEQPLLRCSHTTAEYFLRTLWRLQQPIKVLMVSEPPPGALAGGGGNAIVAELVKSYHPKVCIVAGKRQHRGSQRVGNTLVVNPGWLAEGSAAWIERVTDQVEMLDL